MVELHVTLTVTTNDKLIKVVDPRYFFWVTIKKNQEQTIQMNQAFLSIYRLFKKTLTFGMHLEDHPKLDRRDFMCSFGQRSTLDKYINGRQKSEGKDEANISNSQEKTED